MYDIEDVLGPGVRGMRARSRRKKKRKKKTKEKKKRRRAYPSTGYGVTPQDWEQAATGAGQLLRGAARGARRGAKITKTGYAKGKEVYSKVKKKFKKFKRKAGYEKAPRVVSVKEPKYETRFKGISKKTGKAYGVYRVRVD